jgi:hypothetical protein
VISFLRAAWRSSIKDLTQRAQRNGKGHRERRRQRITAETQRAQREAKRGPSAGMKQRHRPQDDDAHRIVREWQRRDGDGGVARSVVPRLNPHPSHKTKAGRMGHRKVKIKFKTKFKRKSTGKIADATSWRGGWVAFCELALVPVGVGEGYGAGGV